MPDTSKPRQPPFDTAAVNPVLPAADPATVETIRAALSAENDLPPTEPRMRYLVLSQPRTGGTLLCAALQRSGHAGVPFEYLNPAAVGALYRRLGGTAQASLPGTIHELESRRTTSNGVFGLHLHVEQLVKPLKSIEASFRWISRFDRIVFLYRRDKLAQAISLYRSVQSSVWFETEGETGERLPEGWLLDPWTVARHVSNLGAQETVIRRGLAALPVPVLEISYEMLDRSFAEAWRSVSSFLDLPEIAAETVYPDYRRMRDEASEAMAERFLAALRDSDRTLDPDFVRVAGRSRQ